MKKLFQWIVIIGFALFTSAYLFGLTVTMTMRPWFIEIMKDHMAAAVGLPLSAMAALGIVVILEINAGDIKFKGLGFEFEGAAGPVVMWVFVFLSIAGAIKLLW